MALDPPYALNNEEGISFPCGICLLCKDGMVKKTSLIKLKNRKTIELKKKKFKNFGIYVAKCSACEDLISFSQVLFQPDNHILFAKMFLL